MMYWCVNSVAIVLVVRGLFDMLLFGSYSGLYLLCWCLLLGCYLGCDGVRLDYIVCCCYRFFCVCACDADLF